MRKAAVIGVSCVIAALVPPAAAILPPVPHTCGSTSENTPQLAVDPSNPDRVALHYLRLDGSEAVLAISADGGVTWAQQLVAGVTACGGGPDGVVIDPMLDMGAGGRVVVTESWLSNANDLGVDHDNTRLYAVSTDADGRNLRPPLEPDPGGPNQRAPVSFAPGSNDDVLVAYERFHSVFPQPGYLYGVDSSVQVVRSTDGGTTWGAPVDVIEGVPGQTVLTIALLRTGDAVVAIGSVVEVFDVAAFAAGVEHLPQHLVAARSVDGGASFASPSPVGTFATPFAGAFQGCCIPDAAAGPDGALYVLWGDADEPVAHLAASHDGGVSWAPRVVPFAGPAAQPAVAVAGDGTIGVFAYVASGDRWQPTLARSADGGATWSTQPLSEPFSLAAITSGSFDGSVLGPYQDIAGLTNGFAVAFTVGPPVVDTPGDTEDVRFVRVLNDLQLLPGPVAQAPPLREPSEAAGTALPATGGGGFSLTALVLGVIGVLALRRLARTPARGL